MKKYFPAVCIYALMGLLTLGYVCLIRLGLSFFHILTASEQMEPMHVLTRITSSLAAIDIWQQLAWIAYALSILWGIVRARQGRFEQPFNTPWLVHLTWIVTAFFWHLVGALYPLIMPMYRIA